MSLADLETAYAGRKGALFRLALKTGALTVLSAGMYRFWMKTRLRRYFWSSIRIGGVPLEYVGNPWEKLLGFLFAVVVLAFYIGVVNLVLMFLSFSLFQTNFIAYLLSFIGVLPLLFFARYRARRYVLARTRWRGIRFGLEPGAWGYAWRAMAHWLATIATLGLLWPRKAFYLEKYLTDRTWFGDTQFRQGGRWTMLIGAMKHLYIGVGASAGAVAMAIWGDQPQLLLVLLVSLPWALIGLAYWRAEAFRRLLETKELGGAGFASGVRARRVLGIYVGGYLLTVLVVGLGILLFMFLFGFVVSGLFGVDNLFGALGGANDMSPPGEVPVTQGAQSAEKLRFWVGMTYGIATYFAVFLFWSAARAAFVTLPLARHFAETTTLTNPLALHRTRQRGRDEFAEAEGFADALDVGAAL